MKSQKRANIGCVKVLESAWKIDDTAWFEKHPDRHHRLRKMFAGEAKTFPAGFMPPPPAGHEYQILVRQFEPGQRLRTLFCRNVATPVADVENVLHALFDAILASGHVADIIKRGKQQ